MTPTTEYREITLTKGQVTIVDYADFEWLMQWKWHAIWSRSSHCYYVGRGGSSKDEPYIVSMHRQIMGVSYGDKRLVDHVNHDTLNNSRSNLRICNDCENRQNAKRRSDNKSGYKGVYKISGCRSWGAQITAFGIQKYLGLYPTPELASEVVEKERTRLHGEYAHS